MRWEPITSENAVAKLAVASEHAICDFKEKYDTKSDPRKVFELAKDICAFANQLGGTIVVGAIEGKGERKGMIANFAALTSPTPGEFVKYVDNALALCFPPPIANAEPIALSVDQVKEILGREGPATTVVAINVRPMLNAPVGCLGCSDECDRCIEARKTDPSVVCTCKGKKIDHSYRFPIRRVERTDYLRPEEIARAMNVAERRALLELEPLTGEQSILVWFNSGTSFQREAILCQIVKLDSTIMVCVLQLVHLAVARKAEVPLVFVRAVWQSSNGWNIAIDGSAFDGAGDARQGFRPIGGSYR